MNDRATALAPGACYRPSLLGNNLPLVPSSEGFTLVRDEIESIFAVANGYVVTRTLLQQRSRLLRSPSSAQHCFPIGRVARWPSQSFSE